MSVCVCGLNNNSIHVYMFVIIMCIFYDNYYYILVVFQVVCPLQ